MISGCEAQEETLLLYEETLVFDNFTVPELTYFAGIVLFLQ